MKLRLTKEQKALFAREGSLRTCVGPAEPVLTKRQPAHPGTAESGSFQFGNRSVSRPASTVQSNVF